MDRKYNEGKTFALQKHESVSTRQATASHREARDELLEIQDGIQTVLENQRLIYELLGDLSDRLAVVEQNQAVLIDRQQVPDSQRERLRYGSLRLGDSRVSERRENSLTSVKPIRSFADHKGSSVQREPGTGKRANQKTHLTNSRRALERGLKNPKLREEPGELESLYSDYRRYLGCFIRNRRKPVSQEEDPHYPRHVEIWSTLKECISDLPDDSYEAICQGKPWKK
jgi:hypothetical protein